MINELKKHLVVSAFLRCQRKQVLDFDRDYGRVRTGLVESSPGQLNSWKLSYCLLIFTIIPLLHWWHVFPVIIEKSFLNGIFIDKPISPFG